MARNWPSLDHLTRVGMASISSKSMISSTEPRPAFHPKIFLSSATATMLFLLQSIRFVSDFLKFNFNSYKQKHISFYLTIIILKKISIGLLKLFFSQKSSARFGASNIRSGSLVMNRRDLFTQLDDGCTQEKSTFACCPL